MLDNVCKSIHRKIIMVKIKFQTFSALKMIRPGCLDYSNHHPSWSWVQHINESQTGQQAVLVCSLVRAAGFSGRY